MANTAHGHHVEEKPVVQLKADNDTSMQTQLIDSRHVRDPMYLVLLLNSEYGNGNYEVEMRHNCFTIRAPGRLQWSQVYAKCR
ncbi:hypothetical protein F5Y04DRAFT_257183 [Hypomontagnella monticulosa]|nr:hypothetical protein F5Y04DRAFT_257183 [Hypomontagnella monticulosa]